MHKGVHRLERIFSAEGSIQVRGVSLIYLMFSRLVQSLRDRVKAVEFENANLRENMKHAQEAFSLVASAHEFCLTDMYSPECTPLHASRLGEIAELMCRALKNQSTVGLPYEVGKVQENDEITSLKLQLSNEKMARVAAERQLSRLLKTRRRVNDNNRGVTSTPSPTTNSVL